MQIGKPQTFHAISWFDGSKGRKEMSSVRVVVSSRTEPQWERECKLTQSFADVMSEFAAQSSEKWHFSRFSFWIGEQLVRPEELLGSKTNGQSGLLLVSAQAPSEHCLVKVSEKLRPLISGFRHLMALRDTRIAREESLKTGRSLNLWLQVLQQEAFTDPVCSTASMVLHSFLVTQTQSATCERTFARVEGLKILCCGLLGCFHSVLDNNYLVNRGGNTHTHTHTL